jgi:hypothetical protein
VYVCGLKCNNTHKEINMPTHAEISKLVNETKAELEAVQTNLNKLNIPPNSPTGKLVASVISAVRNYTAAQTCLDVAEGRITLDRAPMAPEASPAREYVPRTLGPGSYADLSTDERIALAKRIIAEIPTYRRETPDLDLVPTYAVRA